MNDRVIIGATILGLGGIRTHLLLLCQELRQQSIGVTVFATGSSWDAGTLEKAQRMGVSFRLPPVMLRSSRKFCALHASLTWPLLVRRQAASSLYCVSAGYSQLLLHRLKPRRVVSINHEIVDPPGVHSPAGKCAAGLDVTVANSRKVAQTMKSIWPQKPIRSIPFLTSNGPTLAPQERRSVGSKGLLRIVYLGRMVEQKRPDQLVRCWRSLTQRPGISPARLDLYGFDPNGKMLNELRSFVADSGLSAQVGIHGEYALSELPCILQRADLVVLPSLWEGLPLVLVEAMLHGVPFVATDAGGTEELGQDNQDVIITSTKWEDFESGLIQMANRIRTSQIVPFRLHAWAEARYGHDTVSSQWLECLRQPRSFFQLSN